MAEGRFNWDGYNLKIWAIRNKESLKLIVAGATGLVTAAVSGLSPAWSAPLGVLVAALSKMAIDSLDYWQSE
jgi:hypothetical protein